MERLDLTGFPVFLSPEAGIRLAKYATIMPYIKDKVVLDVACREGYGSALMMRAGARRVVGVDISQETTEKNGKVFSDSKAEYFQADATQLESLFGPATFDVIVSIEDIERDLNDEEYIEALKRVAVPNAVFLIACPNVDWYCSEPEQISPRQRHESRFKDFQATGIKVLGSKVYWGVGSAVLGFATMAIHDSGFQQPYSSRMKIDDVWASFLLENEHLGSLSPERCSYFAGLWNVDELSSGAAYFGLGMDEYSHTFDALAHDFAKNLQTSLNVERREREKIQLRLEEEGRELRNRSLLLRAVRCENDVIRGNISDCLNEIDRLKKIVAEMQAVQVENDTMRGNIASYLGEIDHLKKIVAEMEVGYWRYRRITDKIPVSWRRAIVRYFRAFKSRRS